MLHLKSYVGSVLLAALLLQGCGSSESENTTVTSKVSASVIQAENTIDAINEAFVGLDENSTQEEVDAATREAKLLASQPVSSTQTATQTAGLFSKITDKVKDKVKDGLVKVLDTKLGDKVTTAAFDVVLNSEGVTVVMLDLARKSETTSQIMINSMEADWGLAEKMCPMLRGSTEFGEKFTALAEERDIIGRFFFERIDANMYGCLTDAMLLSNNDAVHDGSVSHSTNAYMGLLMDRYANDYFITPTGSTAVRRADKFVSLLLNTGANATYDANTKTFTGHGDANELINEKFFYSLFKTPETTDSFVSAMDKVKSADAANGTNTLTMLMDNIFLGKPNGAGEADTIQGYLNIIAIGSGMYDGIYGEANAEGTRSGAYGFGAYSGAFIGFAGLIPSDRYMTYARAFMNAGYKYAEFHGINVWGTALDSATTVAQAAWDAYTAPTDVAATPSPARSAGLGLTGSDWYDDIFDLMLSAWSSVSLADLSSALLSSDQSVMAELTDQGNTAYSIFVDGRNADGSKNEAYMTTITNPNYIPSTQDGIENDNVYGIHGLIELAMQEDIFYVTCGSSATDITTSFENSLGYTCDNNVSYTMAHAKAAFTLPAFNELTWEFAYGTATNGAMAYYDNNVDANWLADLSSNELVREYFYPSAKNIYIPNWLLAVDWLSAPANFKNTNVAKTNFDFNAGYFDIYVTSINETLFHVTDENNVTTTGDIDLVTVAGTVKTIEISKVDMGNDDIIAVDEDGLDITGLNVYKIRAITPEDTQALMNYLSDLSDSALSAIGLDSSNTA